MSGDKMADFYIPPQMKKRNNFILWKLETDDKGKQRKIPYSALYNGKASTTNGRTWTTYENALQCFKSGQYGGLARFKALQSVFIGCPCNGLNQ